jgi:hypothetical protein
MQTVSRDTPKTNQRASISSVFVVSCGLVRHDRTPENACNPTPGLRYPDCSTPFAEYDMSKPKPHAPPPVESAEDRLDEALDETFPASDPIAVDPTERAKSTPAPQESSKAKKHH